MRNAFRIFRRDMKRLLRRPAAVLGMIGKEGIILRRTIWPFLLYCLVVGTVCSYLISRVL